MASPSSHDEVIEGIESRIDHLRNFESNADYATVQQFAVNRYHDIALQIARLPVTEVARMQQLQSQLAFYASWGSVLHEYIEMLEQARDRAISDSEKLQEEAAAQPRTKSNAFLP